MRTTFELTPIATLLRLNAPPLRNLPLRRRIGIEMSEMLTTPWALAMMLFVAVNAHATVCCYQALQAEWEGSKTQQRLCSRKRRRIDRSHDHVSVAIACDSGIAVTAAAIVALRSHRKRRKLSYRLHALTPRCLRRENMPWPWPVHISFQSSFCSGGKGCLAVSAGRMVAKWMGNPIVASCGAKLKEVIHSALEEMLVSCLSFVMCACIVVMLRTYSSLVVGVSIDLGAFSVDI